VLQAEGPVLVDFWPSGAARASSRSGAGRDRRRVRGKITVVKVNIDENPTIARDYQIMSIPTMSVFSGGQVVKSVVGARRRPPCYASCPTTSPDQPAPHNPIWISPI